MLEVGAKLRSRCSQPNVSCLAGSPSKRRLITFRSPLGVSPTTVSGDSFSARFLFHPSSIPSPTLPRPFVYACARGGNGGCTSVKGRWLGSASMDLLNCYLLNPLIAPLTLHPPHPRTHLRHFPPSSLANLSFFFPPSSEGLPSSAFREFDELLTCRSVNETPRGDRK